ncbi:transposase, partial [Cryobacterium sp. TMT2-18-3]
MIYPLVRELAVDGVPVTVTCRVLRFSKQAFYQWKRDPISQRDWVDARLTNAAWDIHRDDPAFGYRFISDELGQAGLTAGENRVWRLCSQQRLWSVFAKKRGLTRKAGPPVHDDHVKRKFTATRP